MGSTERLSTTLGLLGLIGVEDTEVRRARPHAGFPWPAALAMAVAGLVVYALLGVGSSGVVDLLVVLLYALVISLLILVLLRAALAIAVEHRRIAWAVAIGGVVLVVVYWLLVHFITRASESLVAVGSVWRSVVLAGVGVGLAALAVTRDRGTREWLAAPLRRAQAEIVGYPPEPVPTPTPGAKVWLKNPAGLVVVTFALLRGAFAGLRKKRRAGTPPPAG